jgi:membrane-associated phospholipid phosphatase
MKAITFILLFIFSGVGVCQNTDIDLLREINTNRNKNLDGSFKLITNSVGTVSFGTPIIVIGAGLLTNDSSLTQKGIYMGVSIIVASGISTVMKFAFNRERPYVTYPFIEKMTSGGSPSFPSGHTSDAFATATSLSIAFPKWYVITPSFLWASGVGYSRMHLGVHYPSDVLVGALVGAGSSYLCFKAQKWLNKKRKK